MKPNAEVISLQVMVGLPSTGSALGNVEVEALLSENGDERVIARGATGPNGFASLQLSVDPHEEPIRIRVVGETENIELSRDMLKRSDVLKLQVKPSSSVDSELLALLSEQIIATRRARIDDLVHDLLTPTTDSVVRLFSAGQRGQLLAELERAEQDMDEAEPRTAARILDPIALQQGKVRIVPGAKLPRPGPPVERPWDLDDIVLPSKIWQLFPWTLPDDQSYRDYLRSVFVLFVHQQKLGGSADPKLFPAIIERQLTTRFFQDFRTSDRAEVPLNQLLVPLVTAILTSATGKGFGFGVAPAAIPVQGTTSHRDYLNVLLSLAPISVQEFANRYRLPLTEPDSAMSSRVKLNIHTLSRALSDTAQGPVEPPDNVIEPQLPDEEGKPILWTEVVGSAPFFLRYDEWLARQETFFPENLFAIRSQIYGAVHGPWLTEDRKKFLEYHKSQPTNLSVKPYDGLFGSINEVHRSAKFLLDYGAADAKLTELVQAIDRSQFPTALRLADEAGRLLLAAAPQSIPGEGWESDMESGNFARPLSVAARRKFKVSNITDLTGSPRTYPANGFERYWELSAPVDLWTYNIVLFRNARDQATRLRVYQQRFVLPILRAAIQTGMGHLVEAVHELASVTGFHIGFAMLGTPPGMFRDPKHFTGFPKRAVGSRFRWDDPLGDRPYTARLMYDEERRLIGPFPLTPQVNSTYDVLQPEAPFLHPLEERYARIVQADAILSLAETLYRSDEASLIERARELYKAVIFLHGKEPGTSAYLPQQPLWFSLEFYENPRVRNQIARAQVALQQIEAGLNFYGYSDEAVPTLSYDTLVTAAQRWATGAKSAQNDYLAYLGRVEQLDLDMLAAKAQERKARATVAIAAEQVEIAKAGVVVAKKLVSDVEKLIEAKKKEIEDANSIFTQFKDYFEGMKSSISSMVDIGKGASEGWTSLSTSGVGEALGLGQQAGGAAAAGSGNVGLGSAMSGLGVVGGFAAFAVLSTTTLQGMADAANKRQGELTALVNETLPAAQAAVRVQERNVTIANLQGEIATSDFAYARDLITYQNERFLNRDFWEALAGVARRSLHRYLDLAGQAAWFAERALAYRLAAPVRVIRVGYFDPRMRDVGGVDRLALDLAEIEAIRLAAARVSVPLKLTVSLARDLPLAFGQLKSSGKATFTLTDDELLSAHPGTFAHRIRAVDVAVEAPGTAGTVRGLLTNGGFSLLRRAPGPNRSPLLRFADAYPVSEFRLRPDMGLHGMPGESLLPFEGAAFTTTWTLEIPQGANVVGLNRITDVRITFDLQAAYQVPSGVAPAVVPSASRSMFVSALALDSKGLRELRMPTKPQAKLNFDLDRLALPKNATITNLAVLLPGVDEAQIAASLQFAGGAAVPFQISNGLALSNGGPLSDGIPGNAQPLNAAVMGSPARRATLTITKGVEADRLAAARDAMLWVEYEVL